jgi:hypothetical protein
MRNIAADARGANAQRMERVKKSLSDFKTRRQVCVECCVVAVMVCMTTDHAQHSDRRAVTLRALATAMRVISVSACARAC